MQVQLGWHFDTYAYPNPLTGMDASEGLVVLGPAGFASLLETRLGLPPLETHQAVRIAQYRRALEAIGSANPFFAKSAESDAWSTAKRLLADRDRLVMAGWTPTPSSPLQRVREISLLDARAELSPGQPERIMRIMERIEDWGLRGIKSIVLKTPRDHWPLLWREVFKLLTKSGVEVEDKTHNQTTGKGADLIREAAERIQVLRAPTAADAGEAVAAWLGATPESNHDVALLAEHDGAALDAALRTQGLPVTGTGERSRHRAALQLLPLGLAQRWKPFSAKSLLELLTAQQSPIHPALGRHLIRALTSAPGIGGPEWNKALDRCCEWAQSRDDGQTLLDEIEFWTGGKRFSPHTGMDRDTVLAICARLGKWAAKRIVDRDDPALPAVAAMADEVARVVTTTGLQSFPQAQLDRILDSVVGAGLPGPERAEASAWHLLSHPGQIHGDIDTLFWWDFTNHGQPRMFSPWTEAECSALTDAGYDPEDMRREREREFDAWFAPLRHATKQIVLVIPESDRGEPTTPHPLWDEIIAQLGDTALDARTVDTRTVFRKPSATLMGRELQLSEVTRRNAAASRRVWPTPEGIPPTRACESPSGMSSVLACPMQWYLNYILGVRTPDMAQLPEGNQLLGSFCHGLVELLVAERTDWAPGDARTRAEELFDTQLECTASTLRMPEYRGELDTFRSLSLDAIEYLFRRIKESKLTIKASEQRVERSDNKGRLFGGYVDLVLEGASGTCVPWDLKWTNSSKYRREEMTNGLPLQLAAYCWLMAKEGFPPHAAYFLLKQQELIATRAPWATDDESTDADLEMTWQNALAAYREILADLESGRLIAAGAQADEANPDEAPLLLEAKCKYCDYPNLCGKTYEN